MFRSLAALALFIAFAGRALALNITLGGPLGIIQASQLLAYPNGFYTTPCETPCTAANTTILDCGDTNDQCLCTDTVGSQLLACEQCLFTQLISMNMKMPDPRVGSTPAMAAFSAACKTSANVTLKPLALVLPPNWVGPTNIELNLPATIVVVGFGSILGISALFLFANLS